tara:strand:- start:1363 stop:2337 length:975 start_codon:yes stop_codon:yes gene_type:complete
MSLKSILAAEGLTRTAAPKLDRRILQRLKGGSVAIRKGVADLLKMSKGRGILQVDSSPGHPNWNPNATYKLKPGQAKLISRTGYQRMEKLLLGMGWKKDQSTLTGGGGTKAWLLSTPAFGSYGGIGVIQAGGKFKVFNDLDLRPVWGAYENSFYAQEGEDAKANAPAAVMPEGLSPDAIANAWLKRGVGWKTLFKEMAGREPSQTETEKLRTMEKAAKLIVAQRFTGPLLKATEPFLAFSGDVQAPTQGYSWNLMQMVVTLKPRQRRAKVTAAMEAAGWVTKESTIHRGQPTWWKQMGLDGTPCVLTIEPDGGAKYTVQVRLAR